jgi:IclR family transcriptional regulator, acetate operon repressor
MATDGLPKTITTVDRATDVLSLFMRRPQPTLGVTEIAQELGLSKAVVYRLVTTLAAKGFVQVDHESRRYGLGPAVLSLGLAYLERIDIRRFALPLMRELSATTNETCTLSIRSGWTRVYVDQITPPREVKMSVQLGQPFPLHAGSSSKAFLAFLDEQEREEYLAKAPLERLTEATIVDAKALRAELSVIRKRGFARSFGERQSGAASVAAPARDHHGQPIASISVCGPTERFRDHTDTAAELLLAATAELSRKLGYTGDVAPARS